MDRSYIIRASGFYLSQTLPDNWDTLSEEEVNDFIADNRWQPFENREVDYVWTHIQELAEEFERVAREALGSYQSPPFYLQDEEPTDVTNAVNLLRGVATELESCGTVNGLNMSMGQEILMLTAKGEESIQWSASGRKRLELVYRLPSSHTKGLSV